MVRTDLVSALSSLQALTVEDWLVVSTQVLERGRRWNKACFAEVLQ